MDTVIKKWGVLVAFLVSVLTVPTLWKSANLPAVAFESDLRESEKKLVNKLKTMAESVDSLAQLTKSTRILILDQSWWRLQKEIEEINESLSKNPHNKHLRDLLLAYKRQQQSIKTNIHQLDKSVKVNAP